MKRLIEKVRETAFFLESKINHAPETGVITGTGLGDAVGPLEDALTINYSDIPHFPVSTVVGHFRTPDGRLSVRAPGNGHAGTLPPLRRL